MNLAQNTSSVGDFIFYIPASFNYVAGNVIIYLVELRDCIDTRLILLDAYRHLHGQKYSR